MKRIAIEGRSPESASSCDGSLAFASAQRLEGLSGAICYYGGKLTELAPAPLLCSALVHLGRDDKEIPARPTRDALEQHRGVEVLVYPAGHGFNSDRRADFDQQCADLAFRETLRFLERQAAAPRTGVAKGEAVRRL